MNKEQQNSIELLCPRCGARASWHFLDETKQMIGIACPNCGRFDLPSAELEQAEFDIAQPEERRE